MEFLLKSRNVYTFNNLKIKFKVSKVVPFFFNKLAIEKESVLRFTRERKRGLLMGKNNLLLKNMILTAIFSGLCFVGVYIKIQLPVGMIHLGNFICIIASLLCGGLVGGISGSLGMGLSDILYYGGFSAGVARTLLLKFGMGVLVGYSFRFLLKKKWNPRIFNLGFLSIFTCLFILSIVGCSLGGFLIGDKHVDIHYTIPLFLGLVVLMFSLALLFDRKLNRISKIALAATTIGILFNCFGEIYIKTILYYWLSNYTSLEGAYIYAVSGIPSLAITSCLTCILCAFLFTPIYTATKPFLRETLD